MQALALQTILQDHRWKMAHGKSHLVVESPRTITRRLENYITKGAREEERRAQKALTLLKARDRQIAYLEKRVSELEEAAANLHAMSLRTSPAMTSVETLDNETSYLSVPRTERTTSSKHHEDPEDFKDDDSSSPAERSDRSNVRVPNLKLSTSPMSRAEEKDEFSTPVTDRTRSESFLGVLRNEGSKIDLSKREPNELSTFRSTSDRASNRECNVNVGRKILSEISGQIPSGPCPVTLIVATTTLLRSNNETSMNGSDGCETLRDRKSEIKSCCVSLEGRGRSNRFVRASSSVPWIRTKRCFRRKICGLDLRIGRARNILQPSEPGGSGSGIVAATALPSPRRPTKMSSGTHRKHEVDNKVVQHDGQAEVQVTLDRENVNEKRNICTQTSDEMNSKLILLERTKENNITHVSPSWNLEPEQSSTALYTTEDLAAQCLIEKTVDEENQFNKNNRLDKSTHMIDVNEDISLKLEYEKIISELEEKLSNVKTELEETSKKNSVVKEKYKRALQNAKLEAARENEIMQGKIVQMCTSVLEKFGPYALTARKGSCRYPKNQRRLKCYKKLLKKLNKRLRMVVTTSDKVKEELVSVKKNLEEKSRKYDTLNEYFTRLKLELETTEVNLNELIKENCSLRKKFEDTREWMKMKIGRNDITQLKDMQRGRELTNLRKKTEEDCTTITQLRSKLLRLESANTNKGFLLSSYKSQLAEVMKEKDQSGSRYKELERENNLLRNGNAQMKAKILLLNNEKEKLLSESEKSETNIKERLETKLIRKYEQSMLHEMNMLKSKCDEVVEVMKTKMCVLENCNAEYFAAIKDFLKRIYEYYGEQEAEKILSDSEASKREARETACTILNMTPGQLSGLMKELPPNKMNSWLSEFHKITSNSNFANTLAKFLFAKAIDVGKK